MTTLETGEHRTPVIDIQNSVVEEAHDRDTVVANVGSLIDRARREQIPVV